jgi:hypothetical protein
MSDRPISTAVAFQFFKPTLILLPIY